jgi:hypothetical protein
MRIVLIAALALFAAAGCRDKPPEPQVHGAAAPDTPPPAPSPAEPEAAQPNAPRFSTPQEREARSGPEACVDQWLKERGLNQYGDPPDTLYAGGTPLFDEETGERTDRLEYVFKRHPELRERCAGAAAEPAP